MALGVAGACNSFRRKPDVHRPTTRPRSHRPRIVDNAFAATGTRLDAGFAAEPRIEEDVVEFGQAEAGDFV
jgi:hypothetical protein